MILTQHNFSNISLFFQYSLGFIIFILYYTITSNCFLLLNLSLHFTLYTLHFTLYTLHFTLYTLHFTLYTLHFTLYTLHFTLYTLHFTLYTLHFTLYTLHFTLYTLHFTLYTLHFTLYTLHFTLYTFTFDFSFLVPNTTFMFLTVHFKLNRRFLSHHTQTLIFSLPFKLSLYTQLLGFVLKYLKF